MGWNGNGGFSAPPVIEEIIQETPITIPEPILYYKMDDEGDTIVDYSTNQIDGVNNGTTAVEGPTGYVRNFDGQNDYISTEKLSVIGLADNSDFAIEMWLNPTGDNQWTNLLDCGSAWVNTGIKLINTQDFRPQYLRFWWGIGTNFVAPTGFVSLRKDHWQQLIMVKSGQFLIMYLNGGEIVKEDMGTSLFDNGSEYTNKLLIGKDQGYGQYYYGKMGIIRIYDEPFTQEQALKSFQDNRSIYGLEISGER